MQNHKASMTLTVLALGMLVAPSFAYEYTFIDLGTLPGGNLSLGMDINDSDHATGFSSSTNGGQAFGWNVADGMTELPALSSNTRGYGYGINNHSDVAGKSIIIGFDRATLWRDAGPVYLGTMFGYDDSSASSLNDHGHVVGSLSGNVAGHWKAFIWLPETAYGGLSSGMHFLTSLPVGSARCASAHAINNAGQIVGLSSSDSGHPNRATLWLNDSPGTFTPHDLGDLGGGSSNAYGINELGQVVGASATASQGTHAFLWLEEEAYGLPVGMNDLGSLGDDSEALGVNNHGQVVGRYFPAGQVQSHAFIWENGVMTDLNDFLPQEFLGYVESAHGINDTGHIVGNVVVGSETHAFVMVMFEPGDANGDGSVDVTDLGILATYYDTGDGYGWEQGDFTGDGFVDVADLGILATNYGDGTSALASIPEPSTLVLASFGLAGLVMCRPRRKR